MMSSILFLFLYLAAALLMMFFLFVSLVTPYASGFTAALGFAIGFFGSTFGSDTALYFGVGLVFWSFVATSLASAFNESYWGT